MNTRKILLAIVLGFLLLQFAAALDSKAAKDTKDAVKGAKETVNAAAKDLKDTIKEAAKDAKANVQDKKETAKEAVKEAAKDTKDKAETVKETVKATANDAKETIKTNAAGAKESVKETVKATKENVKEAAKDAKETIKQAAKDTKETVKEATKETKQKVKETASKAKEEATKEAASLVDTYLPIIQGYVQQATELVQEYSKVAAEYGGVAWKEAKKYGGSAAVQAQEYSVAFVAAVSEYKAQLGAYTYAHAVEIVDKFFDPQHAALIKKNFLNYYGVAVLIGSIVGLYLVVKHLKWLLSPKSVQLFLSAVSLGIYLTLTALTILTSKDPTKAIPASSLASIQSGLFYLTIATTVINVLAFFIYSGRQKSFVVALLSVGLFVEELELRSVIEGTMGTIPDYSLHAVVYLLQSALIFDSIASTYSPVVAKVKAPSATVKSQEIKVEKTEKGKKSKAK